MPHVIVSNFSQNFESLLVRFYAEKQYFVVGKSTPWREGTDVIRVDVFVVNRQVIRVLMGTMDASASWRES